MSQKQRSSCHALSSIPQKILSFLFDFLSHAYHLSGGPDLLTTSTIIIRHHDTYTFQSFCRTKQHATPGNRQDHIVRMRKDIPRKCRIVLCLFWPRSLELGFVLLLGGLCHVSLPLFRKHTRLIPLSLIAAYVCCCGIWLGLLLLAFINIPPLIPIVRALLGFRCTSVAIGHKLYIT